MTMVILLPNTQKNSYEIPSTKKKILPLDAIIVITDKMNPTDDT